MREINKVILHCSDSDRAEDDCPEVVNSWHKDRGFDSIGYHYYIDKKGIIFQCRPHNTIGAHTLNHNHDSLGICLGGSLKFTLIQLVSLLNLLSMLKKRYDGIIIVPHYYFNRLKSCPNFSFNKIDFDYVLTMFQGEADNLKIVQFSK
jgi:hypothetical protein